MPGAGTAATTLITTRGLFIGDGITNALEFGSGLTPWFRLYLGLYTPPTPPKGGYVAAAGSRVYEPGEIADLFRPIDPNTGLRSSEPWHIPLDKEVDYFGHQNKIIILKTNFAGKQFEGTYAVPQIHPDKIVEITNFISAITHKIAIAPSSFKYVASNAVVEVKHFTHLRKPR